MQIEPYPLPCKHRGEPTGEYVNCGCSLQQQPAHFCHSTDVPQDRCLLRIGARAKRGVRESHAECSTCDWRFDDRPVAIARQKQRVMNIDKEKTVPINPRPGDASREEQRKILEERRKQRAEDMAREIEFRKKLLHQPVAIPDGSPFDGPVIRNLAYHLGPFANNGVWQRNADHLIKRMGMFNGRRRIAITTGDGMDDPAAVKEYLQGHDIEFIELPNSATLREVKTFLPLLSPLASGNRNEVTFYGHAKGVTRPVNDGVTVHCWTDIMYSTCLDYWPLVERTLSHYPIAGSFKKVGAGFQGSASAWHYSGTYYWLRHSMVFGRNWTHVDQQWWGTESWPGLHFSVEEAACLFRAGTVPELDLYDNAYFHRSIVPDYLDWRLLHQPDYKEW